LSIDDALIQGQAWSSPDAVDSVRCLLDLPDPPAAIFAASDSLAFSAIEVLRERGICVPDDIAVIGFDDTLIARDMRPALTTVRIPLAEIGRLAADLVLRQREAGEEGATLANLPVEFVQRGTA